MQRMDYNNRVLQTHPVDMHALGSTGMERRGDITRTCLYCFADLLGQNSIYYRTPASGTPKTSAVHALGTRRSNRLPRGQDTSSFQLQQAGDMCALDDDGPYEDNPGNCSEDSEDHHGGPHLAAFPAAGTQPATAATASQNAAAGGGRRAESRREDPAFGARRGERAAQRRPPSRDDAQSPGRPVRREDASSINHPLPADRPAASPVCTSRKREAPRDFTGATNDRGTRRLRSTTERTTATPDAWACKQPQLAAGAPPPGSEENAIRKYIMGNRVCFHHARGKPCERMSTKGRCPYSHVDDVISFGSYRTSQPFLFAPGCSDEHVLYEASDVLAAIEGATLTAADTATEATPQDADA